MANLKLGRLMLSASDADSRGRWRRRRTCGDEVESGTPPRRVAGVLTVIVASFAFLLGGSAGAEVIHDGFDTGQFQRSIWDPCIRPESEISIVYLPLEKFYATKLLVHHYPRTGGEGAVIVSPVDTTQSPVHRHPRLAGEPKRDCSAQFDKSERAELWEANDTWLKFGTEVWYAFTMYIDPSVSPREQRLVIGQWKGDFDKSPMIAQRFTQHHFSITVEQDNDAPGGDLRDVQCRIYVAQDDHPPTGEEEDQPRHLRPSSALGAFIDSVAHDLAEAIHDPSYTCARDVQLKHYNNLPDPFGRWTRMLYHIKLTADSTGFVEVWANGKPIVSASGRIGLRADRAGTQRFKFGPYRNRPGINDIYAMIGQYTRSLRRPGIQ
jgi:hypothetical protein